MHYHGPRLLPSFTASLAFFVGLPFLAGCGGGGNGGGLHSPLIASARTTEGLTATLTQDKSVIAPGETVTYTLTLTNNTTQPIGYQEYHGCDYIGQENAHLRIANADGAAEYPDPYGPCDGVTTPEPTLAPGQSVSDTYTPPASAFAVAGRYTVTGEFATIYADYSPQTNVGPLTLDVK